MSERAQPWDAFLLAGRRKERLELLPHELRDAVDRLIDAACDLAEETYGDPLSSSSGPGMHVQLDKSAPGGRTIKSRQFHRFLNGRAVRKIDQLRTEIRVMLCTDQQPRSGPRFR